MPQGLLLPAGEDEDGIDEIECLEVGLHGDDSPARGEPSGSNAKFWEGLLKEKHEQLLKEEEQQVREQWQTSHVHHVDTSPALDPAGGPLPCCPACHLTVRSWQRLTLWLGTMLCMTWFGATCLLVGSLIQEGDSEGNGQRLPIADSPHLLPCGRLALHTAGAADNTFMCFSSSWLHLGLARVVIWSRGFHTGRGSQCKSVRCCLVRLVSLLQMLRLHMLF